MNAFPSRDRVQSFVNSPISEAHREERESLANGGLGPAVEAGRRQFALEGNRLACDFACGKGRGLRRQVTRGELRRGGAGRGQRDGGTA